MQMSTEGYHVVKGRWRGERERACQALELLEDEWQRERGEKGGARKHDRNMTRGDTAAKMGMCGWKYDSRDSQLFDIYVRDD